MAAIWKWLMSVLVWLSADPDAMTAEAPKAAAAVAVAYATFAPEPEDKPTPRVPGASPASVSPARP